MFAHLSLRAARVFVLFAFLVVAACADDDPAPSEGGALGEGGSPDADPTTDADEPAGDADEFDAAQGDGSTNELDAAQDERSTNELDAAQGDGSTAVDDAEAGTLDDADLDGGAVARDADTVDAGASDASAQEGGAVGPAPRASCARVLTQGDALLDVMHDAPITQLQLTDDRVLAQDYNGYWTLWDRASWTPVARGFLHILGGASTTPMEGRHLMVNHTMVSQTLDQLIVRDSADGSVIATIGSDLGARLGDVGLSSDGSYIWEATNGGLKAWSPTGTPLVTLSGNYERAQVWAAPGEMRVALGPRGENVIERVLVPSGGTSASEAFSGTFLKWFDDGSRFLTTVSGNDAILLRVYLPSAVLEGMHFVPPFDPVFTSYWGFGDYYWGPNKMYRSPGNDEPVWSGPPSTGLLTGRDLPKFDEVGHAKQGFLVYAPALVIDVRGPAPQELSIEQVPVGGKHPWAYLPSGDMLLAGADGALFARLGDRSGFVSLTCGRIAPNFGLGRGGVLAVATDANQILIIDLNTRTLRRALDGAAIGRLEVSGDGATLLASNTSTLTYYDLATGGILRTTAVPHGFELARNAPRVAERRRVTCSDNSGPCFRYTITDLSGSATYHDMTSATEYPIALSPDGRKLVVGRNIYLDGALVGVFEGTASGWLDDQRLLVRITGLNDSFIEMRIVNPQGDIVARPPLPSILAFDALDGGSSIFRRDTGHILEVSTGAVSWTSPVQTAAWWARAIDSHVVAYAESSLYQERRAQLVMFER